jgi:hypothetical protein
LSCPSKGDEGATLFPDPRRDRQKKLDGVVDQITDRYGKKAIKRAGV